MADQEHVCIRCHRYYLTDGTAVGNGYTSNTDPYAHWAYNFPDTVEATPTKNCTYANSAAKYDQVGALQRPAAAGRFLTTAGTAAAAGRLLAAPHVLLAGTTRAGSIAPLYCSVF